MSRMTNLSPCLMLIGALLISTYSVNADVDYNSIDVTGLQNQYQRQLKPKPVKKVVHTKKGQRKKIQSQELLQYQRLLAKQQQPKQPVNNQQRQRVQANANQQRVRALANQQRARLNAQRQQAARQAQQRAVLQQQAARPAPTPVAAPAPRRDAIFEAASSGNVNLIKQLISQGVNVNQANPERETALHMAAAKGHYSAVIYLINHGANIHARTVNNWQPIHHATRFRHAQIANYLKQRGSQIYAKTSDGMSAVDMARAVNDRRIMGVFGVR